MLIRLGSSGCRRGSRRSSARGRRREDRACRRVGKGVLSSEGRCCGGSRGINTLRLSNRRSHRDGSALKWRGSSEPLLSLGLSLSLGNCWQSGEAALWRGREGVRVRKRVGVEGGAWGSDGRVLCERRRAQWWQSSPCVRIIVFVIVRRSTVLSRRWLNLRSQACDCSRHDEARGESLSTLDHLHHRIFSSQLSIDSINSRLSSQGGPGACQVVFGQPHHASSSAPLARCCWSSGNWGCRIHLLHWLANDSRRHCLHLEWLAHRYLSRPDVLPTSVVSPSSGLRTFAS